MEIEEYIAAAQNTKEKKFWLDKLSGEPAKNYFYYDATTQNDNTRSFEKEKFTFTGELFSKFIQLSSNSDLRLHMALTAGLLILIQKYTGEKDIMIGMPIYKEGNEEKFINTALVFRGFVDPAMTFKEILVNVRQIIIDSVEHANYPVELLAEQLGMPVSREKDFPLFDIVILLENIHDKKYVEHLNYNISFTLARKENTLEGIVEYNANRYYQETIKKIISYYQEVYRQVLFNVNLKVSEVDILSETDKKKLLNE
ncbi:MAG TPA: condensation domain-containing protein, partial [Candidatus Kapabacteria bacterium]|nr:condensation domain-containing protein [Candidatus Kapabacteria bacterium]